MSFPEPWAAHALSVSTHIWAGRFFPALDLLFVTSVKLDFFSWTSSLPPRLQRLLLFIVLATFASF